MIAAYIALGLITVAAAWYLNELHERQTRALDEAVDALDELYGMTVGAPLGTSLKIYVYPAEREILRIAEVVLAQHEHTYRRGDGGRCRICRKHLGAHVTEGVAIDA